MARIIEDSGGGFSNMPIQSRLRLILQASAADAGVELLRVTSGGQAAKGSGGRGTGSTRHDLG